MEKQEPSAKFIGGTIVLNNLDPNTAVPSPFQRLNHKYRCPAIHYHSIQPWLNQNQIRNSIPRWRNLELTAHDGRSPHGYQLEALKAWHTADRWGTVVLPTGSGKTFVAMRAIQETAVHTLIIVPTIDLLHQWYARLENVFQMPIGVWYGQEKEIQPITVTTYPSAWAHAETLGNQFKLLIFDEIHHLPAPNWHEIALMCAAPWRLGLTATYPDESDIERQSLLAECVGPVVYRKRIDELTGKQLAEYRTERIRVNLTAVEQANYDNAHGTYTGYMRTAKLRERYGAYWWNEMTRRSAYDQSARTAKVAELQLKEIVHQAKEKLHVVGHLLKEHTDRPMLIFTAHNRFAYAIARHYLIPVITHQTKAAERKAILEGFKDGTYRAIVTSKVLNEGIDVPEAKVAVVLGGSSTAREYVQRLGRILRKKGNTEAILYEIIARGTVDEGIAQRRRNKVKYHLKK
ncbi:MAG: DEAD/DEAH box helicase [Chloroflexota bacterium]